MALDFPQYPQWASPGRSHWDEEDSAAQQSFQSAYNRTADEKSQMNLMTFQQKQKQDQLNLNAQKLMPVANALAGTKTPEEAWDVVSKNPEWMADPIQGQFVDRFLQTQTDIAKAQIGTIQGKINIADTTAFMKRLETITPEDRSAIQGMSRNTNGGVSPMQWQALGLAESRIKTHQEKERKIAEIDALSRGDVATTTINEKGVSTTYKPAPTNKDKDVPQTKEIEGGITLAWVPGGKTLHVIKPGGNKFEFTPDAMRNLARGLKDSDPQKKQILDFLGNEAVNQIRSKTTSNTTDPAPASANTPNRTLKFNPATGKIE